MIMNIGSHTTLVSFCSRSFLMQSCILDLHVGHVGGEVQKNILSVLLWAPANLGEKHCLVCPDRLVASQEFH